MTNHMAEVAKMFGLELEEHFHITKKSYENTVYKFTKDGVAFYDNKLRTWYESVGALAGILTGETEVVKLPWKPKMRERYYYPIPSDRDLWESCLWVGDNYDNNRFSRGLVCKTEEEAVELARQMLAVVKEGKNNG